MTTASTYSPSSGSTSAPGLSPTGTLMLGAVAGVALGYLYFTDHGRQLRERMEPVIETWLRELNRLRETADQVRLTYAEGRDALAPMSHVPQAPRGEL